jgi:inhibitor of KinA
MNTIPTIQRFGDHTVLLSWSQDISMDIYGCVSKWDRFLKTAFTEEILETTISYASIALYLNPDVDVSSFTEKLGSVQEIPSTGGLKTVERVLRVPVCYDKEFAPDLSIVAKKNKLTVKKVIQLHTEPVYTVFFNGFLPGFPYLFGLSKMLNTPRKSKPRGHVFAGSVAIGGNQTGIYPTSSPGGWNVIGRCPLKLFNVEMKPPSLLTAGTRVKFFEITQQEFKRISKELEEMVYIQQWEEL